SWALFALGPEFVRAFHDGPAVVAAFLNLVDTLPQILADFAAPQVAGLAVEAVAPKLTQSVGVYLGASLLAVFQRQKFDVGVVLRNTVRFAGRRAVHVDAQELGENTAQVLADLK